MSERESPQVRTELVRDLGLFDITMVGVGAMIGAGIFVLTGIAAGTAGPALILAFALNGVVTVLTAMAYAELGSAIPGAGGGYLWVKEGLPGASAFLAGWMDWFAHSVAASLYALGFGSYFLAALRGLSLPLLGLPDPLWQKIFAVGMALTFILINFRGVSETGKAGNIVTVSKVLIILLFIASGLWAMLGHPLRALAQLTPFAPMGWSGIFMTMGITFIAFEGYEIIVQAGEEVKHPRRNIPRAIFLSLFIVIPIYILVALVVLGAVRVPAGISSWQWLASSGGSGELGLVQAARQFMPWGGVLLLLGGLLSTMSALNATTFSSTRVSFALGRDHYLPAFLAKIHPRTRTPYMALLSSGALIILMAVALPLKDVAAAVNLMFLLLFIQVNVAVITIRKRYGDKLRYGFLTPFFPAVPYAAIAIQLVLAGFMFFISPTSWVVALAWIGLGYLIFRFYAAPLEHEEQATPILITERLERRKTRFRLLIPVANPKSLELLVDSAASIIQHREGELILLHVATVAPQTPLRGSRQLIEAGRKTLEQGLEYAEQLDLPCSGLVRLGHRPHEAIIDTVHEQQIDLLIMGWRGQRSSIQTRIGKNIDQVVRRSNCNVIVVEQKVQFPIRSVLVPVVSPRQARFLLGVAAALASDDARIDVVQVVPPARLVGQSGEEGKHLAQLQEACRLPSAMHPQGFNLQQEPRIQVHLRESKSVSHHLVKLSKRYDLMVIGATRQGWLAHHFFADRTRLLVERSPTPTIIAQERTGQLLFGLQRFLQFFRESAEEE